MSRTLACVGLAASLLFAGCARSAAVRGTGWWRVTTDHIQLSTDVDPRRAQDAAWAFEDLHRALTQAFPVCTQVTDVEPFDVVLFARDDDYAAAVDAESVGASTQSRPGLLAVPAMLVLDGDAGIHRGFYTQVFLHELTHRFVSGCFPRLPRWLDEGLAKFFETLRVGEDALTVGLAPYAIAPGAGRATFVSDGIEITQIGRDDLSVPSALARLSTHDFYQGGPHAVSAHYASAWLTVHLLMLGPDASARERFREYLRAESASEYGYPMTFAADLDEAFTAYSRDRARHERRLPYRPETFAEPTPVALAAAEAYLLWAMLLTAPTHRAAEQEAAEGYLALAEADPTTRVRATLLRADIAGARSRAARSTVQALAIEHPDDRFVVRARAELARMDGTVSPDAAALLAELMARADLDSSDWVTAAGLADTLSDYPRMVQAAREAVRLAPSDRVASDTLRYAESRAATPARRPVATAPVDAEPPPTVHTPPGCTPVYRNGGAPQPCTPPPAP